MRISYHTFGCRLNRAETLQEQAEAICSGHEVVEDDSSADVIVVRACSVTARAEKDCRKFINRLKENYPKSEVRVVGCLPGMPRKTKEEKVSLPSKAPSSTARAYLKVQDGCGGKCTFCIVPQFRGESVSVPLSAVKKLAEQFAEIGYYEFVVTGCNLSMYKSEGVGLGGLIDTLAKEYGDKRIRLSSYEPCICDDELLDAFVENKNICRFLHVSLQSASDYVLERMKRPYNSAEIDEFISSFRKRLGNYAMLGCDVICGFPGEREEDFKATREFLERHNFVNVHAFPYSERPGTPAAEMADVVLRDVRHERVRILLDDAAKRKERFFESFVGKEVEVCVEKSGEESRGWSSEYIPCVIKKNVPRKTLYKGIVKEMTSGELIID